MTTTSTVIAYAKRTPIGKLSGALASVSAPRLAAALVKDALQVTGIKPEQVDEMILGCGFSALLSGGRRGLPARARRRLPGRASVT